MLKLELETPEQTYKIYGGSSGFSKIIPACGFIDANLTAERLLQVVGDLDRRMAIVSVLLDEGKFEPKLPDFSTKPKREALTIELAKLLDNGWIIRLIAQLASELNIASVELAAAVPAIAPQSDLIQEAAISRQAELAFMETETEAIASNIAEGK
jgi:hypothetical protein